MDKANKNSVRISSTAWDRLKDEQSARRKATGKEPSFADLIDECLVAANADRGAVLISEGEIADELEYELELDPLKASDVARWIRKQFLTRKTPDVDSAIDRGYSDVNPPSVTSSPQEFEPWTTYLHHILKENNAFAAPSIKKNLEAFVRLTDLDGGKNAPTPGEPSPDTDPTSETIQKIDQSAARVDETTDELRKRNPRRKRTA